MYMTQTATTESSMFLNVRMVVNWWLTGGLIIILRGSDTSSISFTSDLNQFVCVNMENLGNLEFP